MDTETIQLLNLSPIPELSEVELSTMLDQLSNLSELNGEITDRKVEDILKEAEEIIDGSYIANRNEQNTSASNNFCLSENNDEENPCIKPNFEEPHVTKADINLNKPSPDICKSSCIPSTTDSSTSDYSPRGHNAHTKYSSKNSANHIKSTIDSLKEFSNLMEKQIGQFSNSSKSSSSDELSRKINPKKVNDESKVNAKSSKSTDIIYRSDTYSKSNKELNCFERLYRERPLRFSDSCLNKKTVVKMTKPIERKKIKAYSKVSGCSPKFVYKELHKKHLNKTSNGSEKNKKLDVEKENLNSKIPQDRETFDSKCLKQPKCEFNYEETLNLHGDNVHAYDRQQKMEGRLILKLIQEMEEIKSQINAAGVSSINEEATRKPEVNRVLAKDKKLSETDAIVENAGIQKLEEKFADLKSKYDKQMNKLETENEKLKEALNSQLKLTSPKGSQNEIGAWKLEEQAKIKISDISTQTSPRILSASLSEKSSLESLKIPNNSPVEMSAVLPISIKESFSQTENESRNIGIQCVSGETAVDGNRMESVVEKKRADNKENQMVKMKPVKAKPFSDANGHLLTKQKKSASEHEMQLMATLRGLQAELGAKDKENRRLKMELDTLKNQTKRMSKSRSTEVAKRCHVGTQTIALGPIVDVPYDPVIFEAADDERERENEQLKARIKALEDSFEMLKVKRINDLQSLHQVHEEEMRKLVSKLETQSALTKHLHSLLVNR